MQKASDYFMVEVNLIPFVVLPNYSGNHGGVLKRRSLKLGIRNYKAGSFFSYWTDTRDKFEVKFA